MITKTISLKTGELIDCKIEEQTEEDKDFDDSELVSFWTDAFIKSKSETVMA